MTGPLILNFGRHKGTSIEHVPISYLKWMVNERHSQADAARAELKRRGTVTPSIEVSGHAIDRASLNKAIRAMWHEANDDKPHEDRIGLHAWLVGIAQDALHQGINESDGDGSRVFYRNIRFVFKFDCEWPVLKTVTTHKNREKDKR